jgi:hypothetical protein
MDEKNQDIKKAKQQIDSLASQIIEVSKEDKNVKQTFEKHFGNIPKLKKENKFHEDKIRNDKSDVRTLNKKLKDVRAKQAKLKKALEEKDVYDSFMEICDKLETEEKDLALKDINAYFKEAFKSISADLDERFEVEINSDFEIVKYIHKNGVKEKRPNTTGQLKVLAMSFIKAITDFASNVDQGDLLRTKQKYPVVIDAAFGDISDGNLEGVSVQLTKFDSQLIVLVAKDQLNTFRKNIESDIIDEIYVIRDKESNVSKIEVTQ